MGNNKPNLNMLRALHYIFSRQAMKMIFLGFKRIFKLSVFAYMIIINYYYKGWQLWILKKEYDGAQAPGASTYELLLMTILFLVVSSLVSAKLFLSISVLNTLFVFVAQVFYHLFWFVSFGLHGEDALEPWHLWYKE